MACFPKIDSPCPYKGDIVDIMDGDICSLCSKPVYDLTDLDDEGRHDLLAGRRGHKFRIRLARGDRGPKLLHRVSNVVDPKSHRVSSLS